MVEQQDLSGKVLQVDAEPEGFKVFGNLERFHILLYSLDESEPSFR